MRTALVTVGLDGTIRIDASDHDFDPRNPTDGLLIDKKLLDNLVNLHNSAIVQHRWISALSDYVTNLQRTHPLIAEDMVTLLNHARGETS